MYASFIVEKAKEKSNFCSVHSAILEVFIFPLRRFWKNRTQISQKDKITLSHCIGKSKDKVTATLIRICL